MKAIVSILLLIVPGLLWQGCDLDAQIDPQDYNQEVEIVNVDVVPLVTGLNYPTTVRTIDSDDPIGTGEGSVLQKGNLLITNAGSWGNHANSIIEVDPRNGNTFFFSDGDLTDLYGEPATDRPVSITFPNGYPWVVNATWCYGSVSILDTNPGRGFDGPNSRSGEPINGPFNEGSYGCSDFKLTAVSVTPSDGSSYVSLYSTIVVRFSLPVNPSSINTNTFVVDLDDCEIPTGMSNEITLGPVEGSYYFSNDLRTVTFQPQQPLVSSTVYELTQYEVTLSEDIVDIYGNHFDADVSTPEDEEDYVISFTTEIELAPPYIYSYFPAQGQQTSTYTAVILYFSEPIRQDSVDEHSFKLIKGAAGDYQQWDEITGDKYYYYSNRILSYIPDDPDWVEESLYTIFATGTLPGGFPGIQDRAGNALDGNLNGIAGGNFWSTFNTHGNEESPWVVFIIPGPGETNVSVNTTVFVLFSEPLAGETINNETFQLWSGNQQIYGYISRANGYIEATFEPYDPLPYDARIDVLLTSAIQDSEGVPLDGNHDGIGGDDFHSRFFTGQDPQNTPPQVASIVPGDGQTGVSITTTVNVTFTKQINPLTVDGTTFFLQQGATNIPATVVVQTGNTAAILTPNSPLNYLTTYTVTLTDSITDLDGRALDGDYDTVPGGNFSSTFTTMTDPSTVPPFVASTDPAEGATTVVPGTDLVVTFSEPMNPATVVVNTSFTLSISGGGANVNGSLSWDGTNTIATFVPSSPLAEVTAYDLVLTTTCQDATGNGLDGSDPPDGVTGPDYSKTPLFTTGVTVDLVLNEVMPDPNSDWDDSGGYNSTDDEWVEIYNASSGPINLNGYYLTDTNTANITFTFGSEILNAGQYRVVIAGDEGVNLSLNNSGTNEAVHLFDSTATEQDVFYYNTSSDDRSWQRIPNGAGGWVQSNSCGAPGGGTTGCPTPGSANYPATLAPFCPGTISGRVPQNPMGSADGFYQPLLIDNWGFGGITYGGEAPDIDAPYNEQYFASHPMLNDIYVFDFNSGFFPLGGYVPELIEGPGQLVYVPQKDEHGQALTAQGTLYTVIPNWDSIAIFQLIPSGPIGTSDVYTTVDRTKTVEFVPEAKDPTNPPLMCPIDIVYDQTSDHLFVANRGNGSVTELDLDGTVMKIYKTNLGYMNLTSLDLADWGEGRVIVLTTTGGQYVNEASGPKGVLYYFALP
ncbi:Ig-like domain-containing protein [bacterium]|nr:Ig-like domain-containing protein [bacterium]